MDRYLTLLSWGDKGWLDELAAGAAVTLALALATLPFGLALGLAVALMKRAYGAVPRAIATLYTTVFRGVPELLTLYIVYFGAQLGLQKAWKALGLPGNFEMPAFVAGMTALGLVPVELPAGAADGYQATVDLVRRHGAGIEGLVVASPANPTGSMLTPAQLTALAHHCAAAGIRLVSDGIYHGILYGTPAATACAASDEALVINSFSKYFSMTGWRIGWMIVPRGMLRAVECLAQNLFISPPSLSQHAAIAAFDCREELDANVARYADNRALLLEELPKAGFERFAPADGAFYLYADVAHMTNDSREFCRHMLGEIGVACSYCATE